MVNASDQINLRTWSRSDLQQIQELWLEYFRSAARSDMRLRHNPERAMSDWLAMRFRDPASLGLVAHAGGQSAGFLIGRIDTWESSPPIVEPRKMGIIDAIHVIEAFRRQGIASRLIERAIEIMRERGAVAVETIYDAWSDASTETWRRSGFAPWMVHAYRML